MNAYGGSSQSGGDTGFRRTWDENEFATKAAEREEKEKTAAKERYDKKLAKIKGENEYKPQGVRKLTKEEKESSEIVNARDRPLDFSKGLNKETIVPANAASGRRGKGAGFYCADCDLTFKDNLAYLDHRNSFQHLRATKQIIDHTPATVEQVRERLAYVRRIRDEKSKKASEPIDFAKRVEERVKLEQAEKILKKEKKKQDRAEKSKIKKAPIKEEDKDLKDISKYVGISGFGSTRH